MKPLDIIFPLLVSVTAPTETPYKQHFYLGVLGGPLVMFTPVRYAPFLARARMDPRKLTRITGKTTVLMEIASPPHPPLVTLNRSFVLCK
jgi:hypothetical protein